MSLNINTVTSHTTGFSAKRENRARRSSGLPVTITVLLSFIGLSLLLTSVPDSPEIIFALSVSLIVAVCIIRWPITGTFMTVVMAILFDSLPSAYAQTWFSELGAFRNLSYLGLPEAILVSLFELVIVIAMISTLVHRFHERKKLEKGPLFWPMISFGAVVLVGEVVGILSGGDFKISLWEIRPLLYLVVLYLLAVNTVSRPVHVRAILWLTVICIAIRCVEGIWRYTLIPGDIRSRVELVLEHDDSLFLVIPFGLLIAGVLWRAWLPKHFFATLLATVPPVFYVMAINGRRAAYLCIMLIFATLLPMVWVSLKSTVQRQRLMMILVVAALVGTAYLAVFWNRYGGTAAPAQAVRSIIDPDERDYNSNLYREQEAENLRFTIGLSPITGIGFGKPMEVVTQMVDLTNIWSLQLYMPHNNMLWVWMRMGLIGFVTFWILTGASILLVMKCLRIGLASWRTLQVAEREQMANLLSKNSSSVMQITGQGLVLRVVRSAPFRTAENSSTPDATTPAATKSELRKTRLEMQQCVDLLLLAYLAQTVMVSMIAMTVVDQGLMSFRLMPYMGVIFGALAATWSVQSLNCRVAAPISPPAPAIKPHFQPEEAKYQPGRRVRIVSPVG